MKQTAQSFMEIPFDKPGRVYRSSMPFTHYDNFGDSWELFRENEIDTIVVLAESDEILFHSGIDLPDFYQKQGLDVIHQPIEDYNIPEDRFTFEGLVNEILLRLENGKNILIHCLAGIGRTGIFLACLAKVSFNMSGENAVRWIRNFIPNALENKIQEDYVRYF